eukprot:7926681-Alexandrium_andersonii.AAC.1
MHVPCVHTTFVLSGTRARHKDANTDFHATCFAPDSLGHWGDGARPQQPSTHAAHTDADRP